ncbi:uncharacterized protein LOC6501948 isoform X15 [Drosophila ananassae]|uniref:uncharacterized protein LOC6501948 isoform X15 n=1 Tax=Drosophila ananassae TaxID=7217 RepID=UPI0013A5D016|nr:uncharacterized protein LOC6501948 isoform X15 [Drosophila ananassae]
MGRGLHGRTHRQDSARDRDVAVRPHGPLARQGDSQRRRHRRPRRQEQGERAPERHQQLLLVRRGRPHRPRVPRGAGGPSGALQLAAAQQDVLRPDGRQGPDPAPVPQPLPVGDARVRWPGLYRKASRRRLPCRPLPEHPQLWRRHPSVERLLRFHEALHRRRADGSGGPDDLPAAHAAGGHARHLHLPVPEGAHHHQAHHSDAGGRGGLPGEALGDRDRAAQQGPDALQAKARTRRRPSQPTGEDAAAHPARHHAAVRAVPLRQGDAPEAGQQARPDRDRVPVRPRACAQHAQRQVRGVDILPKGLPGLVLHRLLHRGALLPHRPRPGALALHLRHRHRRAVHPGPRGGHDAPDPGPGALLRGLLAAAGAERAPPAGPGPGPRPRQHGPILEQTSDAVLLAAQSGDLNMLRALHEQGYSLQSVNKNGQTALHFACKYNHKDIVKYIISCATRRVINMADKERGQTALHIAAEQNRRDICVMLVAAGANLQARDSGGNTAMMVAFNKNANEIATYLESKQGTPQPADGAWPVNDSNTSPSAPSM